MQYKKDLKVQKYRFQMATFLWFSAMQTSKRGLKTELGREAWLCWAHCHPQKRGCRAPSPAHPAHSAAATPSDRLALGTRRSKLLINQGRAPKPRLEMGVFPEHLWAEPTQRAHRNKGQGQPVLCLPREARSLLPAGIQNHQLLYSSANPLEGLFPPSFPALLRGAVT